MRELSDVCVRGRTVCTRKVLTCILITACFVASWLNTAAAQKTGDLCMLKPGVFGVCQTLSQCASAFEKFEKTYIGKELVFCDLTSNEPTVCCGEAVDFKFQPASPQSTIPRQTNRQKYPRFSNEYYVLDPVPSDLDYYTRYSRRDRDAPWWFHEKPFQGPATTASHKPPPVNSNHNHPDRPDRPWWWGEDSPFSAAGSTRQPTEPPPPPPVEETPAPTRRPTRRPPPPPSGRPVTFPADGLSVSERKCKEYSGRVTTQVSALPLVPEPEPVHVDIPKCDFSTVQLIVGGEETKPKEFPHMAALGYEEEGQIEWRCGGSLISEYYVLTAAHCVRKNHEPTYARLGDLNLKRSDDDAEPVNYLVDRVTRHPLYKPPAKYNDIALLRLDRKVQFSDFIRPACLYTKDTFDVNKTVATGWGKIEYAEKQSDVLLKVVISIIENNLCNELYEMGNTRDLKNGIADSMMCAGELKGGKDTCQGDSGGPIQITRPGNQCIYSIIGVTSFGKFCAAQNAPGVYTRVSSFVPWIESVVWPNGESM